MHPKGSEGHTDAGVQGLRSAPVIAELQGAQSSSLCDVAMHLPDVSHLRRNRT